MTEYCSPASWFLAQFKPNCHHIAKRNLTRQGFQCFLPQEEVTRRRNNRFTRQLRPLFPGYVFVALDKVTGGWQAINSTYGITRLVSFGGDPAEVPSELISALRDRCDESGTILPPRYFQPGDAVTLANGPFADLAGRVELVAPDRRIWVLIDLMGRQTRVAVSEDALR